MRPRHGIFAVLPICLIALCACRGEPAAEPVPPSEPASAGAQGTPAEVTAETLSSQLDATLAVVAAEPTLKYPRATWVVELTLANHSSLPVWFLIPEPPEFSPALERGAWAIEAVRLGGQPTATLVRISATHGLAAFHLAPGARLTVRDLSLESWHPEPVPAIELWAVSEILLDGRPLIGDWLGDVDPTLSGPIEVQGAAEESLYEWVDPNLASHPLAYAPLVRWTLDTGLDEENWPWRPQE